MEIAAKEIEYHKMTKRQKDLCATFGFELQDTLNFVDLLSEINRLRNLASDLARTLEREIDKQDELDQLSAMQKLPKLPMLPPGVEILQQQIAFHKVWSFSLCWLND